MASIDRSAMALNESLQLVLESDGENDARPDLSVLQPDFEILARRSSRSMSTVNGRSSVRQAWILLLRPRRAGTLRIPPITVGDQATRPLELSVAAPAAPPQEGPVANGWPFTPSWGAPGFGFPPPLDAGANQAWSGPPTPDVETTPVATPAAPLPEPALEGDVGRGASAAWIWISVALALAWMATLAAWWHSGRRPRHAAAPGAAAPAPAAPATEEMDPLRGKIEAVRAAYRAGDAGSARETLLAWAGEALPEDAPSNLARLAQRCPQPLRDQILMLEEAFFSPLPIPWDEQRVWEGLAHFSPSPREEPASFRRAKPIRRRAGNPDAQ